MPFIAYQRPPSEQQIRSAQALIMDEDAYREIGHIPGQFSVVIKEGEGDADHFAVPDVGSAIRTAMASAGCENVLAIGGSIYKAAIAFGAKMG